MFLKFQLFKKSTFLLGCTLLVNPLFAQKKAATIYHGQWIDFNKNGIKDVFEDPTQTIDRRVENLLSLMTLEEKTNQTATLYGYGRVLKDELPTAKWKNEIWKDGIANIDEQLNSLPFHPKVTSQYSFPFSKHADAINQIQKWFVEETRMGIPVDFTNEGIHGLNHDRATPLPSPINIGSTWNKEMVYKAGLMVGREGKALGYTNIYAPILDLARDPRWGRVVETYGEDPFLVAEMGKQMVLGIQENGIASTLKHFAAYSMPKGGRDGNARTDPHIAPKELHELHLYPFKRVIQEAGVMGIMSSYNDWDGLPVTGSKYFLTDLLRKEYGFKGYVVSDSEAVEFLLTKHHVAQDYKEAVRLAIEAGLNVRTNFTPPSDFILPLRELVKEGKVSMQTLDSRVGDVLRIKFRLGLFDQPYVKDPKAADKIVHTADDEAFVTQLNRESLVLLKNENNTLPLDKNKIKNIFVTGPLAEVTNYQLSRYGPSNNKVTSVLQGIKNYAGNTFNISYAKGCDIVDATWPESEIIPTPLTANEQVSIDEAVAQAKNADVIIAVVGEDEKRVGESLSRTGLGLPGRQFQLIQALKATGKPVVLVLINGQPLTINWENRYVSSILEAWFPGPQGGKIIAEALFGDYNPGGKLSVTFPKTTGQIELNFPYKKGSHNGQPGDGPNGFGNTAVVGALFPFGYGLSYTTFAYKNLTVTPEKQFGQGNIEVTVEVTNTGKMKGDEVVQLYLKDMLTSVTTYESVLRGFERVMINPGETKTVKFILQPKDLELLDKDMNWVVEPGVFKVKIGSSSEDIRLEKDFTIIK
ncbi:glycoside hydrolase family 3 N-terminal domain-containing protein [Pedobacter cryophilus]|uniref:Beta-glucosidase n=1 Tax=Pedobacter cryophilus TaxID=2571271 RepID=A0A4U1BZI3_9SPHI|nr:glycoside hydrolase family 3 N-terminal domain-containing protein [Pedobacter cryophilus]TKB96916.1 beta-glucosidase [Pedobacter cryophilus]